MSMDDNYIMARNMELLAEENPRLHKEINSLKDENAKLLKQVQITYSAITEAIRISVTSREDYDKIVGKIYNILSIARENLYATMSDK